MLRIAASSVVLAVFVGCGYDAQEQLGGGANTAAPLSWEALDNLVNEEALGGAEMSLDMGEPQGAIDMLKSPEFEALATAFEEAPLPATAAGRKEAKAEFVKELKALMEAAEGGASEEDLKTAMGTAQAALKKLRAP